MNTNPVEATYQYTKATYMAFSEQAPDGVVVEASQLAADTIDSLTHLSSDNEVRLLAMLYIGVAITQHLYELQKQIDSENTDLAIKEKEKEEQAREAEQVNRSGVKIF